MFGLILLPADGRSYDTRDAVKADWEDGKDFRILDGPLCSLKELPLMRSVGFRHLQFIDNRGKFLLELHVP
jgi:hypothetical protein